MQKIFFPSSRPRFINRQEVINDLKRIAMELAAKNKNIEAIYLFGSYAWDNASFYSDADVLVVLKQISSEKLNWQEEFILEFSRAPIPVDVLVNSRKRVDSAFAEGNHFFANVLQGIRLV